MTYQAVFTRLVFIQFFIPYGRQVWVNIHEIVAVEEKTQNSTLITLKNGKTVEVTEHLKDVMDRIESIEGGQ